MPYFVRDLAVCQRFCVDTQPVSVPSPAEKRNLRDEIVFQKVIEALLVDVGVIELLIVPFPILLPSEAGKHVLVA
jgi:hypothetical protein